MNEPYICLPSELLQGKTITFVAFRNTLELPNLRHAAAAAEFNVISAEEIILTVELPPWDVHVRSSRAIVIVRRNFLQLRKIAEASRYDAVRQIASHCS